MATKALNRGALYIRAHPRPQTMAERKEIVKVLERFGGVEMFRSLKYHHKSPDPAAFLALLETQDSTIELLESQPIKYSYTPSPATAGGEHSAHDSSSASSSEPSPDPSAQPKTFTLHVSPSIFSPSNSIPHTPLYGPYNPVSPRQSMVAADLAMRVPKGIGKAGVCDWATGGSGDGAGAGAVRVPWRLVRKGRGMGRGTRKSDEAGSERGSVLERMLEGFGKDGRDGKEKRGSKGEERDTAELELHGW